MNKEAAIQKEKHSENKKVKETKQKAEARKILNMMGKHMGDDLSESSSDDDRRNVKPTNFVK